MPGLAGIYDPRAPATEIARITRTMRRVLDVPSVSYAVEQVTADGIGCLNFRRGDAESRHRQPVRDDRRGVWLILDGELYNDDELQRHLGEQPAPPTDDDPAALCLALYLNEGADFVRRLNGQFNAVVYHEHERRLLIATDRYGYRPLFFARAGARLLFATEMKAIVAAWDGAPRVNAVGVLSLAATGRLFGDYTWLDPIRVVDPGTVLEIDERGVSSRRYFRLRFGAPATTRSIDDFADGFAALLKQAAARMTRLPGRVGIPLSGGLDSRSTLLALDPQRQRVVAYTFGDAGSRDVQFAQQLAAIAGVPHLHLPYAPGYLGAVLAPIVWRTEGLVPYASTQFTSLHFHRQLAARMDVLLYGHCGDALTGAHLRPELIVARSKDHLAERIFRHERHAAEDTVRRVFNAGFYRRYAPAVLDVLRTTFADIDQDAVADVADVWDMEQRQRRGSFHSPALDRYRFAVRTVFLDNDLLDHLLQAPLRWRVQQRAYKRMLVTAFPHAAAVPWAYTGRPIRTHSIADLADVGWNAIDTRVRRYWARRTGNHAALVGQDFRNLAADLRAAPDVAHAIRDFARASWFPGEIFDRAGIEDLVQRHWEKNEDHAHLIGVLATFATAWRFFVVDRPADIPPEAQPDGSAV